MPLRDFVRKSVMNFFIKISYEYEENNGISELLEILCSIINGFQSPLKPEHIFFLEKGLLPLHKVSHLSVFHTQLQNCIVQYIEKDPKLSVNVINHLLKVWPVTNAAKEVLYLQEFEEIFELASSISLAEVYEQLFLRLSNHCVISNHFQVAERTLFLLNNDHVIKMITESKEQLFPIVLKGLLKNSKHHWNQTVQSLTYNVVKVVMEIDQTLFDSISKKIEEDEKTEKAKGEENVGLWAQLEADFN